MKANRQLQGAPRRRLAWPILALVGYTNAGKSTLFQTLTGAAVEVEDRLFSTLDPTFRRLCFSNQLETLLIDTVGLIRKLPHQLVNAFRATLEELQEADLLLHVVNLASPQRDEEYLAGVKLLKELGLEQKPMLTILNKKDLVENEFTLLRAVRTFPQAVAISAQTGAGIEQLKEKVVEMLSTYVDRGAFFIPFDEGSSLSLLHEKGKVHTEEYRASGVYLEAELPKVWFERLRRFKLIRAKQYFYNLLFPGIGQIRLTQKASILLSNGGWDETDVGGLFFFFASCYPRLIKCAPAQPI